MRAASSPASASDEPGSDVPVPAASDMHVIQLFTPLGVVSAVSFNGWWPVGDVADADDDALFVQ